jgi:hypothetical protein
LPAPRRDKDVHDKDLHDKDLHEDLPRDARQASRRGTIWMKTIRPDNTDPIPLRISPHRMGTIMIRFVGLLFVAVVVLALIWSR